MTEMHTLRPGLLVALSTSIRGNVSYRKVELERSHIDGKGEQVARWETTRVIADPVEHEAAVKVRTKVRGLITAVCSQSAFGLLCPEANADKLTEAIREARALADEFNSKARMSRLQVSVIYGRIAADDVEAIKAITEELRSLMTDMQDGIEQLDVKAVRDAANKARALGEMLSEDAKGRLEIAITAARKSARQIVKAGETVGLEIDRRAIAQIDMARTSFLDLDIEAADIAVPVDDVRALDFA